MKTPEELLIECWYGKADLKEIKQWCYSYIEAHEDIPLEIFDLVDANEHESKNILLQFTAVPLTDNKKA